MQQNMPPRHYLPRYSVLRTLCLDGAAAEGCALCVCVSVCVSLCPPLCLSVSSLLVHDAQAKTSTGPRHRTQIGTEWQFKVGRLQGTKDQTQDHCITLHHITNISRIIITGQEWLISLYYRCFFLFNSTLPSDVAYLPLRSELLSEPWRQVSMW